MALVLHTYKGNKSAEKALIAAEYVGVQIDVPSDFQMGVTNKTPAFLKMNPIGKVPVLETPEGSVFESNAIARYVSRLNGDNSLNGSSLIEYAQIEQWIDFSSLEIYASILRWFGPRMGFMPYSAPAEEGAISTLKRALDALNTHLTSNTYLVGHSITLADIITVCNLNLGFATVMTKKFTSEFPHVERYFWTVVNQPNFTKVKGLWLFRGPEIPKFIMDEVYDMELYEWTKVDISDEAQKERVSQMIEDAEPFEGEALLDAKCFK
ncbi:Translation elongation factor EF1B, gamma chain [Arabidopsis thaliana]|uniref:AT1G09640 protein n=1 Tax=Arabidopsis thaliana TaxID=3702 RepID=C0Z2L8_ARATH|nr:Translation elongation factor EF1B, gamma chain [Arabidopsis thaliana]AEE28473.1 Translation elongation factor EF1B, gamma chain [Arabidopsis thaliana]BAH56947.1 AT1G09640 [Arabidopsis thaliana]|eukprot:NP_001184949.1 Translation elongation factor EF1B, gamma chain [Arabidopsis thaliana]